LAHVASAEGINCVEKIAGIHVDPIDYGNVPGCTYATPEIASVGLTEKQAREKGYELKLVNFRSLHQEKTGAPDGFVKVILMLNTENG
jgi:dihydrolipoamide dehydrogenase